MLTDTLRDVREKIVLDHFRDEVAQHWDDVLATFPHPRYEIVPTGVVYDGRAETKTYYTDSRVAFPDQRHEMIALRHSDDAVITEFYLLGTHRGPFGGIPPTGNAFKVRMTAFFVFDGETLVTERIYFDVLSMLKQLFGGLDYRKPSTWLLLIKAVHGMKSLGAPPKDTLHTIA